MRLHQTWTSFDGADRAAADQLDHAPVVVAGVNLRAHLRGELALVLEVRLADDAGLVHGVGQRLLAIDVLAAVHRPDVDEGVGVVGRRADNGVDVLLVEALAPVGVGLGLAGISWRPRPGSSR